MIPRGNYSGMFQKQKSGGNLPKISCDCRPANTEHKPRGAFDSLYSAIELTEMTETWLALPETFSSFAGTGNNSNTYQHDSALTQNIWIIGIAIQTQK